MEKAIKIRSNRQRPGCVVRLNAEAATILSNLEKSTGQGKGYLASQLIIQGSQFIKTCPAECQDCENRESCPLADES